MLRGGEFGRRCDGNYINDSMFSWRASTFEKAMVQVAHSVRARDALCFSPNAVDLCSASL